MNVVNQLLPQTQKKYLFLRQFFSIFYLSLEYMYTPQNFVIQNLYSKVKTGKCEETFYWKQKKILRWIWFTVLSFHLCVKLRRKIKVMNQIRDDIFHLLNLKSESNVWLISWRVLKILHSKFQINGMKFVDTYRRVTIKNFIGDSSSNKALVTYHRIKIVKFRK